MAWPKGVKKTGHNKVYNETIKKEVLRWIEDGKSLDELHASDPLKYPKSSTVGKWIETDTKFNTRAMAARKILSHRLVEKLHYLRDNPPNHVDVDKVTYKQMYDVWTKQLKSVHDELKELGSIFNVKYTKAIKQETSNEVVERVVIMDYSGYKAQISNVNAQVNANVSANKSLSTSEVKEISQDIAHIIDDVVNKAVIDSSTVDTDTDIPN